MTRPHSQEESNHTCLQTTWTATQQHYCSSLKRIKIVSANQSESCKTRVLNRESKLWSVAWKQSSNNSMVAVRAGPSGWLYLKWNRLWASIIIIVMTEFVHPSLKFATSTTARLQLSIFQHFSSVRILARGQNFDRSVFVSSKQKQKKKARSGSVAQK